MKSEQIFNIAAQLAEVMNFLHNLEPPLLFRNLKPSCVFVDSDGNVKLTDLGQAKVMEKVSATFKVVVS